MANPTDRLQYEKLSKAGKVLLDKREVILELWKRDLRQQSDGAAELTNPILVNTLPSFIDNLAEALSPAYPRSNAVEDSTIAEEHGGERARLTDYKLSDLLREYQILRENVYAVLSEAISLTQEELKVIQVSFNMAMRESATAFTLVHTEIREQFVATLTHDLRNPLNSISMASQLLQDAPELSGDSRGLALKIYENTRRMDRMIQDLLDVTYVRAGGRLRLSISETSMLAIVREVVSQMTLSHGKKFLVQGEDVVGFWDTEILTRAIENLASNAIKYGNTHAPVRIFLVAEQNRAAFKIHNEGNAIPVEEQEAIFQAYRRSRRNEVGRKGWGIGLPLVRAAAEAHGGSLHVDSAPERGTTFMIDIPIDARPFLNAPTIG